MQKLLIIHLALMVTSLAFVMTAVIIARKRKAGWLKNHKPLALTGAASALAGFVVIFFAKAITQFPHFHSPHALAGATAVFILIFTVTVGLRIASGPKNLRPFHRVLGRVTAIVIMLTAISGLIRLLQLSGS